MRPQELNALISSGVPLQKALAELREETIEDNLLLLAIEVGAPLVPTLELLERELFNQERTCSELRQAQAIPQATRKLLLWLPVITVMVSEIAGLNSFAGLVQPLGLVALVAALGLLWLGARITLRMLNRFESEPPKLARELLALKICLSAGVGLSQSEARLGQLSKRSHELVEISQRTGAALSKLIDSEVRRINAESFSQQLTKAKKLSVSLLIPLSATTLPAFLLLTIVPMVIGIAQ